MLPLSALYEIIDIVNDPNFANLFRIVPILSNYPVTRVTLQIVETLGKFADDQGTLHLFNIEEICRDTIRLRLLDEID